jgi:two-component system cell cycle response regulator
MAPRKPLDSPVAQADGGSMTDRRALFGAAAGIIGAGLGAAGVIVDSTWLGVAAGSLALVAGAVAVLIGRRASRSERSRVDELEARVADLEEAVEEPVAWPAEASVPPEASPVVAEPSPGAGGGAGGGIPIPPPADGAEQNLLTDPLTGLFSVGYFRVALDARISAARRHLRPVAVVILDVVEGLKEGSPTQSNPRAVADSISATVRDADTACRMGDGRFALVLEDTPENGAIWTVERVRRRLAESAPGQTMWAGVACYPAHAFDTDEILGQAEAALTAAREWRQDRIEVAVAP